MPSTLVFDECMICGEIKDGISKNIDGDTFHMCYDCYEELESEFADA